MEIILSIISLIVSVLALFVAIFVGWWVPNDIRIMDKLSAVEPMLYFIISHYGGSAGHGINTKLQNRGNVTAYNLALYLPGIKEPLWRIAELLAGKDHLEQSPLADDDPLYTRPFNGLTARLVYHAAMVSNTLPHLISPNRNAMMVSIMLLQQIMSIRGQT